MASNLSSIGFVFKSADYGRRMMGELAGYAMRRIATVPGDYAVWRSGAGAEIWFHVEGERSFFGRMDGGRVIGLNPFFAGEGKVALRITKLIQGPEHSPFDGVFLAEAGQAFSLAFDAVDYAVHNLRSLPITATAQLVGFARELSLFASEADFRRSRDGGDIAVRSFVGDKRVGFGAADNDNAPGPEASSPGLSQSAFLPGRQARLRGVVVKYSCLENEVTERTYHWILVDGPGGTFDIVADRDLVSGPIEAGMIIETIATFSGRLVD